MKQQNQKVELLDVISESFRKDQRLLNDLNMEQGSSTWLTTMPIREEGYDLNKQHFWDLVHIRYGWRLTRLLINFKYGVKFDLKHSLSCKKGGFVSFRHNQIQNVTASLLPEVCKYVRVEPQLQLLTGETFEKRIYAITGDDARTDI